MSQEIFQLENDEVIVSKDNKTYIDTLDNFKVDYTDCPIFNNSFVLYNRTLKQYVLDSDMKTFAAVTDLDTIIDSIDAVIAAKEKRLTAETEKKE